MVRILILDPNELSIRDCVRGFVERGWEVTYVPTFLEALRLLEGPPFDMALIEMTLPDILGTEAWAFIQKIQPNAIGIITTSSASLHRAINAIGAGAHAYLLKPLDVNQLCSLAEQLLGQQQVRNETRRIQKQMVGMANLLSAVSRATDAELVLDKTLAHLLGIVSFDLAFVYVLNRERGEWLFPRTPGIARDAHELQAGQIELLAELAKQAVSSMQPVAITNSAPLFAEDKERLQAQGLAACAVVPILGQTGAYGALVVANKSNSDARLEPLDVQILSALGHAVAIALDRAQLYQQLRFPEQFPFDERVVRQDIVA